MAHHARLQVETGLAIYFCDPHSPWQRGMNENTNGLLRQYFPKGTQLSAHGPDDLAAAAAALNGRPRKTLGWKTPAEALDDLLRSGQAGVATTSSRICLFSRRRRDNSSRSAALRPGSTSCRRPSFLSASTIQLRID